MKEAIDIQKQVLEDKEYQRLIKQLSNVYELSIPSIELDLREKKVTIKYNDQTEFLINKYKKEIQVRINQIIGNFNDDPMNQNQVFV